MARPLRIELAGLTYHVTARGNDRRPIYHDDDDRWGFLNRLAVVVQRYDVECHAYCLMGNHYHLVIRTPHANLSAAVQHLNGPFAQRLNRRHSRVGHVFEGRFGAQIIQDDRYLLTACRYVVLNPVRAGLVKAPGEWPWSSYLAMAGLGACPEFLRPHAVWDLLHDAEREATARFRRFVGASDPEPLPADAIVGDDEFVERFRPLCERASIEVPRRDRQTAPPLDRLFAGATTRLARNAGVTNALRAGYRLTEIARFLGLDRSTLTKMLGRSAASPAGVRS